MPRIIASGLVCVAGLGVSGCSVINAALEDALSDLNFRIEAPSLEPVVAAVQETRQVVVLDPDTNEPVIDPDTNLPQTEEVEVVVVEIEGEDEIEEPEVSETGELEVITVNNVEIPVEPLAPPPEDPNLEGQFVPAPGSFTAIDGDEVYRFVQASEGSFAISAYNPEDTFTEFSGGVVEAVTPAPTAGVVGYEGDYVGDLPARTEVLGVEGTMTITADFGAGSFDAAIINRQFVGSNADDLADLDEFVDVDQILLDMEFSGEIDALGSMEGNSTTTNVTGEMLGAAYESGVVGIVAVNHENAVRSELLPDPLESGVFDATETP